jgi:hypothetical protein
MKFPKTIGPQFVAKAMPWVETFWHAHKRYPLPDEIAQKFGFTLEQVELLNCSTFWNKSLERRGITPVAGDLSVQQVAAISLITNFTDRRTIPVKLAAIGVTEEQINGWYQNPEFQRELGARTDSVLETAHPEVQAQLIRQIQRGNIQAIKMYYEVTGRAQSQETVNLKLAMQRMLEVIQRHVKDPAVLQSIATEMLGVTDGDQHARLTVVQAIGD